MKSVLSNDDLRALRESQVISQDEIAYRSGDLVIAENVITSERRVLDNVASYLNESKKKILKG